MSRDLEKLAERGKAARKARAARRPRARRARTKRKGRRRSKPLTKTAKLSLQHPHFAGLLFAFFLVCALPVGVVYLLGFPAVAYVATLGGSFVVAILGVVAATKGLRSRELAWLRALPFSFDAGRYLSLLEREEERGRLVVRVRFEAKVPEDARDTVIGATFACGADAADFRGDDLVVRSSSVQTYFRSSPGSDTESYYSNRTLHRFFRDLVDDGLRVVHRSQPVDEVTVSTEDRGAD